MNTSQCLNLLNVPCSNMGHIYCIYLWNDSEENGDFGGFSDDTQSLGLLTIGNLMVSFVIAFCKCCAEVVERIQASV